MELEPEQSAELLLEFVIKHVSCKNVGVKSSPLLVNIFGCPEMNISPKSTSICKIVYGKGKRIRFFNEKFPELKGKFYLINGHGDTSIRASATIDFFEIYSSYSDPYPAIFNVECGMDTPEGERFGFLAMSFQFISQTELQNMLKAYSTTKPTLTPRMISNPPTVSRDPADPVIPRLKIPSTSRSITSSIHERYLKKNELWIGNHSSTHTETPRSTRSSASKANLNFTKNFNDYS